MASIPSNQPFDLGYSLEACLTEQFLLFRSLVLRSLPWFLRKTAKAGTSEHPQRAGTQGHLKSHSCLCSLSALVSWLDRWCFDSTSDQAQRVSSAVGLLPLCLLLPMPCLCPLQQKVTIKSLCVPIQTIYFGSPINGRVFGMSNLC